MSYRGPSLSDLELRYPFAPRSRKFFESIPVEEGLASREVVGQAQSRLLNALGRAKYEPHISELIEFSSFFAAALVASQDPFLRAKFSKKEAERAKEFFVKEGESQKRTVMRECFGVVLEPLEEGGGRVQFSVPFESYLGLATKYELTKAPKWKLTRQALSGGTVFLDDNLLNDLFGDSAQGAISEGVKNLRRAAFPKQLLEVRANVMQYVPVQESKAGKGYFYVEDLLNHPVSDGRHRLVWLVLAPYCLPPDTIVAGDFSQIADAQTGSEVIGAKGQHQEILRTSRREYDDKLVIVRASGMLPLRITPEHPVLTVSTYPEAVRKGRQDVVTNKKWKVAADLVPRISTRRGDYLIIPRVVGTFKRTTVSLTQFVRQMKKPWLAKIRELSLDKDTAWILGVYVAEGSNTVHNRTRDVVFTLSTDEQEMAGRLRRTITALGLRSRVTIQGSRMHITTSSLALGQALDAWCGRGADKKRIPEFLIYHENQELLQSFLDGYMKGDGARQMRPHTQKNTRPQIEGATTSRTLALQLQLAYARLGKYLSLYLKKGRRTEILGVPTIQRTQYMFVLRDNATRHRHILTDHEVLVPITSVESVNYKGIVHNVETPDGTYLAGNVVVHNCVNVKKMSDEEAIDRIRGFVAVGGETRDMKRFVEYNVRRARRNGLLPPTLLTLKREHPDLYGLLPKEVLSAEVQAKPKASRKGAS